MNTLNAFGFLLCGLVMILVPTYAPGLFPPNAFAGNSSGLWVEFMGWVNSLMGAGYLVATQVYAAARRFLTWQPDRSAPARSAQILRPPLGLARSNRAAADQRRAA